MLHSRVGIGGALSLLVSSADRRLFQISKTHMGQKAQNKIFVGQGGVDSLVILYFIFHKHTRSVDLKKTGNAIAANLYCNTTLNNYF